MKKNRLSRWEVFVFLILSVIVILGFGDSPFVQPIRTFVIAIHEACHAFAALLTGGQVNQLHLETRRGFVISSGGIFWFIAMAGYVGTALIGALMILFSKKRILSEIYLSFVALLVLSMNFFYIDSYLNMTFWITNIMALALIVVATKTNLGVHISVFTGTFLAMDSISDVRSYLLENPYQTDAGILARYYGMEWLTLPIAFSFFLISLFIWLFCLSYTIRGRKNIEPQRISQE